jgi:hypothetical protein
VIATEALVVLARASWPAGAGAPPPIPGFIVSSFSPLAAAVADRCLTLRYRKPPVDRTIGERIAVIVVSVSGDVGTSTAVARAVDDGKRVAPLLFFQSVPSAVVGHVGARWGLAGPVVCSSPVGDPVRDAFAQAALLISDGDADEVLLVLVEQGDDVDTAQAVLVGRAGEPEGKT